MLRKDPSLAKRRRAGLDPTPPRRPRIGPRLAPAPARPSSLARTAQRSSSPTTLISTPRTAAPPCTRYLSPGNPEVTRGPYRPRADPTPALYRAIHNREFEAAEELLAAGGNIRDPRIAPRSSPSACSTRRTSSSGAARHGRRPQLPRRPRPHRPPLVAGPRHEAEFLKVLIDHARDPHAKDNAGDTPLATRRRRAAPSRLSLKLSQPRAHAALGGCPAVGTRQTSGPRCMKGDEGYDAAHALRLWSRRLALRLGPTHAQGPVAGADRAGVFVHHRLHPADARHLPPVVWHIVENLRRRGRVMRARALRKPACRMEVIDEAEIPPLPQRGSRSSGSTARSEA